MSTHCSRYPECGCTSFIGTKCHLSDSQIRQSIIEDTEINHVFRFMTESEQVSFANFAIAAVSGKQESLKEKNDFINSMLEKYIHKLAPKKVLKTGGDSNYQVVDNPDRQSESGYYRKKRNPMKHLTPPKKRRR